jgi:hypothetical protein
MATRTRGPEAMAHRRSQLLRKGGYHNKIAQVLIAVMLFAGETGNANATINFFQHFSHFFPRFVYLSDSVVPTHASSRPRNIFLARSNNIDRNKPNQKPYQAHRPEPEHTTINRNAHPSHSGSMTKPEDAEPVEGAESSPSATLEVTRAWLITIASTLSCRMMSTVHPG